MTSTRPVLAEAVEPPLEALVVPDERVVEARLVQPVVTAFVVEETLPPAAVTAMPVEWLGFVGLMRRGWWTFRSACEWIFGVVSLIVGLAFLSAIPFAQFLTLGYLLEVSGRIGRTGRLRDGFFGMRKAARVGSIVIGVWLMLLPLRFVSELWQSAEVIDPGGRVATTWKLGLIALTVTIGLHVVAACSRGGKLRHFFWPFTNPIWLARRLARGGYYAEARDAVCDFVLSLRLPYYFWLGVRGFAGGFMWLVVPITLIALGRLLPAQGPGSDGIRVLVGLAGALQLIVIILFLPFLQVRFAVERRFRVFFELFAIGTQFWRAPWACAIALFFTLLFAIPLYLLKIEMIPRETVWLPSLVFLVFSYPTRLLCGWAIGRARRRTTGRHWFFGTTAALFMVPVAAFYVLIVFFTQYTGWNGVWSLYEQHVFLLPVPFM